MPAARTPVVGHTFVVPSGDAPARVACEDVSTGNACSAEQSVEVSDDVLSGSRHEDRAVDERRSSWPIIGAHTGESGHARENHRPRCPPLAEVLAPEPGGAAVARFPDDRWTARASTL